jgi:chromosome segregation ATPase
VDKFENYSFDYTEYKKQVGIYRLDLDVLNIERDRLHEEIRKLNEDSKRLTTQLNHVKTEIENKDIEIEKLTKTIKLSSEEKKLLSNHNKNLINETKILNEQIKQLKSLPPVPSDYIPMSQHEENLRKQEEKLKADFSHQLTTNQSKAEKELQELIKKVEILERESVLLQSNFNIAQQEKNELQELCRTQNIKIKKLISFKDYAAKKMSETITSYNSKIVDYKNTLSKQKNEYSKVISKLKDVKEDEVKIDELLAVQSNMADSNKIEDIDSVGELFEVSNDKIWKIKSKELNQNIINNFGQNNNIADSEVDNIPFGIDRYMLLVYGNYPNLFESETDKIFIKDPKGRYESISIILDQNKVGSMCTSSTIRRDEDVLNAKTIKVKLKKKG